MTTKFEDKCLGVSTSTQGILSVWSRIYKDGRSPSLIVRDGMDTYCVVKEVPLVVKGSLITLAVNAYEATKMNASGGVDVAEPEGMNEPFDDRVHDYGVEYNRWTYG